MKQRLHIAKTLVHRPPVVILDEPTIGLDPAAAIEVRALIAGLIPQHTVLLTTHDMHEADVLCSQLAIVDRGVIVAEGTPDQLKASAPVARQVVIRLASPLEEGRAQLVLHLADLPSVAQVTDGPDGDETLVLRCTDTTATLDQSLALLRQVGAGVRAIDVREPSLEDAFLGATGRTFEDAAAEAEAAAEAGPSTRCRPAPTAADHRGSRSRVTVTELPTVETAIRPGRADLRLVTATVRVFLLRFASNPILLIRAPLTPVLILIGFHLAYEVSGQQTGRQRQRDGVPGDRHARHRRLVLDRLGVRQRDPERGLRGNHLVGDRGPRADLGRHHRSRPGQHRLRSAGAGWSASWWGSPSARTSTSTIRSPRLVSLFAVYVCCLCIGLAFGGLFVLTRQSNAMSNFLQTPMYLLAGFFVPRSALPEWLQKVSDLLPVSHAIDALRATTLTGGSFSDVWPALAADGRDQRALPPRRACGVCTGSMTSYVVAEPWT